VEPPFTERHRQEGSSMVLDQQFPEHASRNLVQLLSQLGISVDPTVEKDEDPPTREKLRTEATSDGRTLTKWQHHCTRTEDSFLHATDATNAKANDFASSLYIGIGIFSNSRRQAPRLSWADYSFKYRVAWPREVEQLKAKLSDSQAQVLPIIQKVSVLQKLARIYYNLNWYRSSLEMQQQLLAARKSQQQINPNELVITCLEIVDLYLFRQDFRTAARVHSAIHFQIQKILSPKHPIHLFSSYLYALILYRQSKYREGEKIIRTVVQITYGWNNLFSIRALQLLGWFMEMNSSALLAYVENSYRFNLDNLGSGNLIVDYLNWYLTTGDVLRVLISQGDYKAGDKLCAYIIERVGLVDGEDDLDYLAVQRLQAQIWYHQGKLSESCNLLCKLVNDLDSFDEYTNPLLQRNLFYTLALVQEKMGDDVGAMKCYRKCLEMEIRVYGLQHEVTLDACGDIGDCYGRLGRHGDALRFYGKVVERLRNILGSDHDSVKMVEEWSEWTRENMEEARKKVSSVEDTDEDEDMDRDEGTDMEGAGNSAIRKTVEEMDRDSDSDCDLSFDGAGEMAHDNLQDDILQYFDWDAFFDCPTPSFYGFN
jgi:tetratricopeptide (TPR) repeat protein